jgi:hypothetical protein
LSLLESTLPQQRDANRRDVSLPAAQNRPVVSGSMIVARKVALRVNGRHVTKAMLRHKEKELELVIADPFIGEFVIDESFTVELLELVHPQEIRSKMPSGGWRKISLRILVALLGRGVVQVVGEN